MKRIHWSGAGRKILNWCLTHGVLLAIVMISVAVELAIVGADQGWWGPRRLRAVAYQNGGFWIGLLGDWRPNYSGQAVAMFGTYAFLHAGLGHLAMNMVTLLSLGLPLVDRIGQWRFLLLYVLSALGGALGFALLSNAVQPMVGASGALFGLAGAWLGWEYAGLRAASLRRWPVLRVVLLLVALNVVMYWALDGRLAWETHLGGFVAGWAFTWPYRRFAANTRS